MPKTPEELEAEAKAKEEAEAEEQLKLLPEDKQKDIDGMKAQMKAQAAALKAFEKEKAEALARAKADEEESLKKNSKYKELATKYEQERNEAIAKAERIANSHVVTLRAMEISKAAMAAGIREEAINDLEVLVPADEVELIRSESGIVSFKGVAEYIENVKKLKPFLVKTAEQLRHIDPKKPGFVGGGELTGKQLVELRKKDPAAYKAKMAEMLKKN